VDRFTLSTDATKVTDWATLVIGLVIGIYVWTHTGTPVIPASPTVVVSTTAIEDLNDKWDLKNFEKDNVGKSYREMETTYGQNWGYAEKDGSLTWVHRFRGQDGQLYYNRWLVSFRDVSKTAKENNGFMFEYNRAMVDSILGETRRGDPSDK
jgi:hypothetical protein